MKNRIPCSFTMDNAFKDSNLIPVKLRLLHENVNRNKSSIEFSVMDKAKDSLKNKPILAYIKRTEDGEVDFDEHNIEIELKQNDEGEYYLKKTYKEFPVGIIPESTEIFYEAIDGKMYMGCTGYIHKDYSNETIELLEETDGKCVSIEIEVRDGVSNADTGIYEIKDFVFKGVTILSDSVTPGMDENCRIDFFKQDQYSAFLEKIYKEIYSLQKQEKEGEDMSVNQEPIVDPVEPTVPNTYGLSVTNLSDQAYTQIAAMTVTKTDYWGDEYEARMFYYIDLLPNENIVVVESASDYSYFGVPYTVNEDTITLDFDSKKEYISEWREKKGTEDTQLQFDLDRDELKDIVLSKFNAKEEEVNKLKGEFAQKETEITNLNVELEGLKQFKQSVLDTEYKSEIENIAAEFTLDEDNAMIQLSDEEISEFKEKAINKQITKEEFKGELYKLQGMKFMAHKEALLNSKHEKFSAKDTGIDLKIDKETKSTVKPYGGILG